MKCTSKISDFSFSSQQFDVMQTEFMTESKLKAMEFFSGDLMEEKVIAASGKA